MSSKTTTTPLMSESERETKNDNGVERSEKKKTSWPNPMCGVCIGVLRVLKDCCFWFFVSFSCCVCANECVCQYSIGVCSPLLKPK